MYDKATVGYAANSIGPDVKLGAKTPRSAFDAAHRTFSNIHDAASRAEDLAVRLCGSVPTEGNAELNPCASGIFSELEQSADSAQESVKRIIAALDRIARGAGI